MRAAVALVVSMSLLGGACFPNNARHRTIAKLTEGGVLVGGIGLLAVVNSGADCMTDIPGQPNQACEDKASLLGTIGLGLVLTGLIGFIVTVSTSPDDDATTTAATTPSTTPKPEPTPAPAPEPTLPTPTPPTEPPPPTEPTPPTGDGATP